ncbi:hypothetical protein K490DRAFT_34247 [Saccharata proteae CBS 121410]|uniref:YTH domain-containing protein n=1 Tax=Saccharata proteae CBS 121410 TaxID=1314787 RepID=A0A9P4I0S4_9PEZI|nr:hypothetical protein K490DRAFT_34247 [Saccharata proteae CBS 121410]
MAYFWVQQWFALPIIAEEQMGDSPEGAGFPALDTTRPPALQDEAYLQLKSKTGSAPSANAPFQSQYSSLHPSSQHSLEVQRPAPQSSAYNYPMSSAQAQGPSAFNMGAMMGSLPDYAHNHSQQVHQPQRGLSGASTSALVYQLQQISQYPGQAAAGYGNQHSYGTTFPPPQYPQSYAPFASGQQRAGGPAQMAQNYSPYALQTPHYMYYPSPYGPQSSMTHPSMAYMASQMDNNGRRPSVPSSQGIAPGSNFTAVEDISAGAPVGSGFAQSQRIPQTGPDANLGAMPRGPPRGPPRKPKQSGHALWVGNLPPGTTVIDLKDHFSRDATKDIESLFLISKSNCAFVNYRTEASCAAAMHRFHDSRFNGVRLVCRLRRSSAPVSGVPSGPSAMSTSTMPLPESSQPPTTSPEHLEVSKEQAERPLTDGVTPDGVGAPKVAEKFFVVKSLTLQDLELSVRNGIWATQAHNEEALNKAFEAAENVYLIFSANKSGEYFGYARMASPISEDATEIMSSIPEPEAPESSDAPKSIPTPATDYAPRGKIIDDSARGTIFWEADLSEGEDAAPIVGGSVQPAGESGAGTPQIWGKPFKIEWVSTNRLPFYRTRGLRNPWNANREVKIARDGTELETSVGKRLIQMFHRLGPLNAAGSGVSPLMHVPGPSGAPVRPY